MRCLPVSFLAGWQRIRLKRHKMLKTMIWPLAMMMSLSACGNGPSNDYCAVAEPIYVDKADKLTPNTARGILKHDDIGHALCNWPFTV